MICPVYHTAIEDPQSVALRWPGHALTYEELNKAIDGAAQGLREDGVTKETRVAIYLETSWQFVVFLFALFRLKAVAVPLNSRVPLELFPDILSNIACRYLITDPLNQAKLVNDQVSIIDSIRLDRKEDHPPSYIEEDQEVTILFSSGSTGTPKAILQTWGNHYYSALGSNTNIVLSHLDRWLLSLPLYHVAGIAILIRCFIRGAAVVIQDANTSIGENLIRNQITHASLVGTQLKRLLEDTDYRQFPSLKALLVGGSALSRTLIEKAWSANLPLYTTYGMSEMSSQVTTTPPGASMPMWLTSGRVLPYREVMCDSRAEILVKGKTLFSGYLVGNELLSSVDEEGWFHTGDVGHLDEQGYLHVTGRIDNMFISGGENIYPEEIERALETHPDIDRAMVVPVSDSEFGMRPVAFVDSVRFRDIEFELVPFLEGKIARFMIPRTYFDWDSVQSTGMKELRSEYARKAMEWLEKKSP